MSAYKNHHLASNESPLKTNSLIGTQNFNLDSYLRETLKTGN
jgi:hypothetical protein